ncbi:MAG: glycosyltransferase family 4 protein [Bacteroidota bacterium]
MPPTPPLHICFVAHEYHEDFPDAEALLEAYHSLTEWCTALQQNGCKVSAVVRFKKEDRIQREGIDYLFVHDRYGPQLTFWQIPKKMHRLVVAQKADVVHAHNFNKVLQHRDLAKRLAIRQTPLLLQNHGETPRYWLRNIIQERVFSQINAFLFCARGQEKIWQEKKIFSLNSPLYYVMEGSTHFRKMEHNQSRQSSGLKGQPVVLWVGHLNDNKDPLTILSAFDQLLVDYPQAQLYMIYRQADLLNEVKAKIRASQRLTGQVTLLGEKKRNELVTFYSSADYFILGSHREGSGYAALEAIACGCIPILTDIYSYRMMTDEGRIGPLWPPGEVNALVQALKKAFAFSIPEKSEKVQQFFHQVLSYPAIAKSMISYYQELIEKSSS